MNELLVAKGWVNYYSCKTCGDRKFYNHLDKPGYEIRVKQKNQTFSILLNNMMVSGPHWGYQLEEKLLLNGI
jgi:hypothetical protein